MKTKMNCEECGKEFEYYNSPSRSKRRFCSHTCHYKYSKQHKIGFWNSEFQREMTIRANKKHPGLPQRAGRIGGKRRHKLYPKQARKNGKKSAKTNRKNKTGLFDSKIQSMGRKKGYKIGCKKGLESQRKNKTGIFDPKFQREMIKKGLKSHRENKPYTFNRISFDSKSEMEIGMCIHYQIEKLKEGKNYQINVGNLTFDFFVKGIFIEYHPWDWKKRTPKKYYQERRNALNKNGYKKYELIVIK